MSKTVVDLLNELLESERSGIIAFEQMAFYSSHKELNRFLALIRNNEARNCSVLHSLISRREVAPTNNMNNFSEKLLALEDERERIEFAIKGCAWTARKITEFPEGLTSEEQDFLSNMHKQHIWNIGVMRDLLKPGN
ncbi:MAG: DUF6306 domain-containing protein [Syntrophorhabdaceae bacterium]|nr:DUF6306 domain-containing protein [Syntrophorhabdaceae bacterium]